MKIGIIGLGDIAQKAYLPVLSEREDLELVFCTRKIETLNNLSKKYKVQEKVQTVEELIAKGVEAAFVSAATDAHCEIAYKLLNAGINTYIDKPVSTNLEETKQVVKLAKESGKIAMVGFNRRFAPMVRALKEHGKASLIIMQKNRFSLPDYARRVVLDDFIHVVDTLRFLMGTEVKDVKVEAIKHEGILHTVILQLIGEGCIAMGIMDRNGGVTEEIIEYTTNQNKYVVNSLVETTSYHNKDVSVEKFGDWTPTLYKRGFYQITDYFIECVKNNRIPDPSIEDSLITHDICERIVDSIKSKA